MPGDPLRGRAYVVDGVFFCQALPVRVRDTDDLQAYRELVTSAERLQELADRLYSPAAETAVRAAAEKVRTLASALYRGSLADLGAPSLDTAAKP